MLRSRSRAEPPAEIVAALDVGTHKICCLIASAEGRPDRETGARRLRVLGFGHQRSRGIEAGAVADMALAREAVAAAVTQAEKSAAMRLERVVVGIACGMPRSRTFAGHVELPAGKVSDDDIARLDEGAHAYAGHRGEAVLSLNRIGYGLDATMAIREPRGLAGRRLSASHHAVTADPGPVANLVALVRGCQLEIDALLPAAYASALASTGIEDQRLGIVSVDIGAGLATIGAFADGHFVHCATLSPAGQQVTLDLARMLAIPLAEAERIKTLYGNLALSASDEHEVVPVLRPDDHADRGRMVTRADIGRLIGWRYGTLLAGVSASLDSCGIERIRGGPIVLTGGASQLMGLEGWSATILRRPVSLAQPPGAEECGGRVPTGVSSRAFACVVGLAMAAARPAPWLSAPGAQRRQRGGYLGRVEQWLRESF